MNLRRRLCATALLAAAGAARSADWLAAPALPAVPLKDADGNTWTLPQALEGTRVVVVSFFFTGCQTVCPPQTALLREARQQLHVRGRSHGLRWLALSVDPLGDGPAQLRDYARRFDLPLARPGQRGADGEWLLLTGERAATQRALAAFGVPPGAPGEHPSLLWLADTARGRWTRSSSLNPPEALASLVASLQDA